jgi:predicted phage terminase large subunit-like protein
MNPREAKLAEYRILQELEQRRARQRFMDFIRYTKPDYETNWHHALTAWYLNEFAHRRIKRLMIFEPPRHGKSEQVSRRLPAYIHGIRPDDKIIAATYTEPLAAAMNRDVQRIMDAPSYIDLFPGSRLFSANVRTMSQGVWLRNSDTFEIVGRRGMYRCAGVGGALTGFGMDVGIIDDPIKNQEEAESKVFRDRLWEWWGQVFYTRLEKNAQILLTMTRWHEDDLAGRILAQAKADGNAEDWIVLCLPALCEINSRHERDPRRDGEPLWSGKYDAAALAAFRRNLGSRGFAALYQQRPAALEGGIIKRAWLRSYIHPPGTFDRLVSSWDTSFKSTADGSFVVGQVWGARGPDRYLLYQFRSRADFPETLRRVREVAGVYPRAHAHLVEDKANGSAIIDTLKSEISSVVAIKPDVSKEARLSAVSAQFEAGNVYLPDPSIAPWIEDYIEELLTFPNAQYDDQADSTSQALEYLRTSGGVGGVYAVNY